jgi:site-specific DNA-methyltransferase (adenine-specific)
MNTEVMFSSKIDTWETPQDFFDMVNKEFNFELDVCATDYSFKCNQYFTPEIDGLVQDWNVTSWMNPPYGRGIGIWIEKAVKEVEKHNSTVVALLPARTDTKWFQDNIYGKYEIRFIRGRLKFGGAENSAPFPSMLVIFKKKKKGFRLW